MLPSVELPSASTTSRFDSPCVYSWYTTAASSPPFAWMNGSSMPFSSVSGSLKRYICIRGGKPSGGVFMFALSLWFTSGRPTGRPLTQQSVFAPSSASVRTGSPPNPRPDGLLSWKFPAASVNPIGLAARWSWKVFTK